MASPAMAYIFFVNTTSDTTDALPGDGICKDNSGNCSLRAAVMEANASNLVGDHIIILQPSEVYNLTKDDDGSGHCKDSGADNDDLDISSTITIYGNNAIIKRASTYGCDLDSSCEKGELRIFEVLSQGKLTLRDVSIQNGCADSSTNYDTSKGGRIFNNKGEVTIINSSIQKNKGRDEGGGIYNNAGSMNIIDSSIYQNTTNNNGGGILNKSELTIIGSSIYDNSSYNGGGIYCQGTSTITNSTIYNNIASKDGAGLFGYYNNAYISFVTFAENSASGNGGGAYFKGVTSTVKIKN